jgi:hypothetical protein
MTRSRCDDYTESNRSFFGSLPEALFIAGLTALAYWLAFLYQVSYLHFFDLPPDLAEVSLQSILLVVLALAALSIVFWTINLVPIFFSDDPSRQRFIFSFVVLPLLFSAWVFYFGLRTKDWFLYLLFFVPAIYVSLNIILVALLVRSRWNRFVLAFRSTRPTTLMQGISQAFGPRAYRITAIVILLSALACITGFGKAATQKVYFLFPDSSEIAVIRIYSDRILAVPFDRGTKTVRPEVIIRKIDQKDIRLMLDKDVGPLTKPK